MASVLLQVPRIGRDVWHKTVLPRIKTNSTHKSLCTPSKTLDSSTNPGVHAISLISLAPMMNKNSAVCQSKISLGSFNHQPVRCEKENHTNKANFNTMTVKVRIHDRIPDLIFALHWPNEGTRSNL